MALTDRQKSIIFQVVAKRIEEQKQLGNQFYLVDLITLPADKLTETVNALLGLLRTDLLTTKGTLDQKKLEQETRIDDFVKDIDAIVSGAATKDPVPAAPK